MKVYIIWGVFLIVGFIIGYILASLRKPIGVIKLYQQEDGMISAFLELERDITEVQRMHNVKLRVENTVYYEK